MIFLWRNKLDAIPIRCNIALERLPILCVCGDSFNSQHALYCPKGELVITSHNKLRNLTTKILGEVWKNMVVEALLTSQKGEEFSKSSSKKARADL